MIDPDQLPDKVLSAILQNLDLPDDESGYLAVSKLTPYQAFDAYLHWYGFIGFTTQLIKALDSIRNADTTQ